MRSLTGALARVLPPSCTPCTSCSRPDRFNASLQPGIPFSRAHNSLNAKLLPRFLCERRLQDDSQIRRQRGSRASAGNRDENSDSPSANSITTTSESEKDVLAAKLAAAEAEAEALKKELAARRGGSREIDLAKLKIPTPEKRIDGTGYREQLFSGPGAKKEPKKWGITEAELFLSKGAPTEGSGLGGDAMEAGADAVIMRRLFIGLGLSAAAGALAFVMYPSITEIVDKIVDALFVPSAVATPTRALVKQLGRKTVGSQNEWLKNQLETLEGSSSDAKSAEAKLKISMGSKEELKDNFLSWTVGFLVDVKGAKSSPNWSLFSAAALIDGEDGDRASRLAFDIFEYLNQADTSKYFENLGEPTSAQQVEFLKFSLQSIKAARLKIEEYLTFAPSEALQAVKLRVSQSP